MLDAIDHAERVSLLGLNIHNLTYEQTMNAIHTLIQKRRKSMVCFVNAHCVNVACRDEEYRCSLRSAEMVLPDGSGVLIGSRILHTPIRENLNGTDLIPKLCAAAAKDGCTVFLLGGKAGVAEAAAANLEITYPGLRIVGTHHGYFRDGDAGAIIEIINQAKPDILLVALGVPLQEKWIAANRSRLDVGICFAVGGLFDFLSCRIPRAPLWLRKSGLEWSFRLLMEPRRMWKRYLIGNSLFLARIGRARLSMAFSRKNPLSRGGGYATPTRYQ